VEPRRALGRQTLRELDRVAALQRHRLAPPTGESDDAPAEDVDGRNDLQLFAC